MDRGLVHTKTLLTGCFVALCIALIAWSLSAQVRKMYEDVMFALVPSAARAYEYGSQHLDARDKDAYDFKRAEYFFEEAFKLDSNFPNTLHQLARIAFLRGDFDVALARINAEIAINPTVSPSSYYMRGLIKGYQDDFEGAAEDYAVYLESDGDNWAAINDYAWVLLKAGRTRDALVAVDWGLISWPDNAWLLNSKATAHFELGQLVLAEEAARRAHEAVVHVTEERWLEAYPGNDPLIALQGVEALRKAIADNMHTISLALQNPAEGMR